MLSGSASFLNSLLLFSTPTLSPRSRDLRVELVDVLALGQAFLVVGEVVGQHGADEVCQLLLLLQAVELGVHLGRKAEPRKGRASLIHNDF